MSMDLTELFYTERVIGPFRELIRNIRYMYTIIIINVGRHTEYIDTSSVVILNLTVEYKHIRSGRSKV